MPGFELVRTTWYQAIAASRTSRRRALRASSRARPLVELHAGSRRQGLERLRERHAVALHDEAEDVAAEPAAEALPALAGGRDDEARGLLAVERAQALERRARLLERDRLPDHVRDLEPTLHFSGDTDGRAAPPGSWFRVLPVDAERRHPLLLPDMTRGLSRLDKPYLERIVHHDRRCVYPWGVLTSTFVNRARA